MGTPIQSKRRVLITGANGLLGQKLVDQLSNDPEFEVIATGRGNNRNPAGNYVYHQLDITDQKEVKTLFEKFNPNSVINTAAMTHVDDCELNPEACQLQNVMSVHFLAEACDQHNTFFIHLSTDFIFDGNSGPYKEDDIPNPQSVYARSKFESEGIVRKMSGKWAIVRTMLVYGVVHEMNRSNIILWVKSNLEQGKSINVVNDQWRMPTLAEDLASGCILILKKQAQGVYHISGRDMLTPYEMAIKTAQFFRLDETLIREVDGSVFSQPAKRPARTGFILNKAYTKLKYAPTSFEEGLEVLKSQLN